MKFNVNKKIIIAGHRGNPKDFPENTMKSFMSAIEMKVDMIETDIHTTKDGELVLIHDDDVKRTTDGQGLIKDMTFEQVTRLNAGNKNEFMNIPTLRQLLEIAEPAHDLLLDLELKVYLDEGQDKIAYTVDKAIKLCEEFNMDKRIMFNCFDAYVLEYIYKNYGKRFILHGYYPYSNLRNITIDPTTYLDYACYWSKGAEAKQCCDFLISHGIEPCTGTNTSKMAFDESVSFGCSMFTENDPLSALKYRNEM